jgi:hypothetical protein
MDAAADAGFPVQASLAALFTNQAQLSAGAIKLKDAYAVYIYDNTLYVIEATGQMIKDQIEWTAGYFNQYAYEPAGVTVNSAVRDYNYDLWAGVDYEIDVTKPVGQRVVKLELDGEPLAMDQVVRLALNNYRATGRFPAATKLYQSTIEVRELVTDWIMDRGTIAPEDVFVQNFRLLPPVALWQQPAAAVTRSDNADLLWTAFGRTPADYYRYPNDKAAGSTLTREAGAFLLANRALAALEDAVIDMQLLMAYDDFREVAGWARASMAWLLEAGIFTPAGDTLLPQQPLTNAEALAWVYEATH